MIDWNEIEKACMSLDKDCVPQNAREWDVFIRQYENCLDYYEGRGHDFTFEEMQEDERLELVDEHMYLGKGYKKSVFECSQDLNDEEKKFFKGVEWRLLELVRRIWTSKNIFLNAMNLTKLPSCPRYVRTDFTCGYNKLTNLKGAPKYVGGNFNCDNNELTSLEGAPEHVGEDFDCDSNLLTNLKGAPKYVGENFNCRRNGLTSLEGAPEHVGRYVTCWRNERLHASIPERFQGKDLHKYVGMKESFVMGWDAFTESKKRFGGK
jgi:hypothetical protein